MVEDRAAAVTAEHLARIGSCYGPTIAHDNRTVAFVTTLAGSPQIWTVPATGGFLQQVTALDDPVTPVAWSPTADRLAFAVAPGGGMHTQVYVCRPNGTGLRRLTDGAPAMHSALVATTMPAFPLRIRCDSRAGFHHRAPRPHPAGCFRRRMRGWEGGRRVPTRSGRQTVILARRATRRFSPRYGVSSRKRCIASVGTCQQISAANGLKPSARLIASIAALVSALLVRMARTAGRSRRIVSSIAALSQCPSPRPRYVGRTPVTPWLSIPGWCGRQKTSVNPTSVPVARSRA